MKSLFADHSLPIVRLPAMATGAVCLAFASSLMAAPPHGLPADIRHFLDRREQCDHWTGEEPYDAARRRQIAAAIDDLACVRIERDEARLRKRHARNPAVIAALDAGL